MKPVLLTGATGFIGQRLQKALLAEESAVTAIVRPSSANRDAVLPGVNCMLAGLDDPDRLCEAFSGAAAVVYCAGSVRGRNLDDFRAANVDGVRAAVNAGNRAGNGIPMLLLSSLAASRPHVSDYANSKFLGEQEIRAHAQFPWAIFRPPAVYGPGDREMLPVLKMVRKGLVMPAGPREQRLSLIHVDDLASAVLAWLKSWPACDRMTFTLDDGHGGGYDWNEITRAVRRGGHVRIPVPAWILSGIGRANLALSGLLGYAPMLTPGKARELTQPDWVCNNKDLVRVTGWQPEIGLREGVTALFESSEDQRP